MMTSSMTMVLLTLVYHIVVLLIGLPIRCFDFWRVLIYSVHWSWIKWFCNSISYVYSMDMICIILYFGIV